METPNFDRFQERVWEQEANTKESDTIAPLLITYENAKLILEEVRAMRAALGNEQYLALELDKLQRFLDELEKEEDRYFRHGGSLPERCSGLLSHYEHKRNQAVNLLGAFAEKQVIALQAMKMIVHQCYGLTHRQQNARLDVLEGTLTDAIDTMLREREQEWQYMEADVFGHRNWDYRKLMAETRCCARKQRGRRRRAKMTSLADRVQTIETQRKKLLSILGEISATMQLPGNVEIFDQLPSPAKERFAEMRQSWIDAFDTIVGRIEFGTGDTENDKQT